MGYGYGYENCRNQGSFGGEIMGSVSTELRQAVLQAAIQGKLTEQLPEDGNAKDLLKQIKVEKERLIKKKKIKKEKELAPITEDEILFDIPNNWVWIRIPNIMYFQQGVQIDKNLQTNIKINEDDVEFLRIINFTQNNKNEVRYVRKTECIDSAIVSNDSLVMVRYGTAGLTFFGRDGLLANNLFTINSYFNLISKKYIKIYFDNFVIMHKIKGDKGDTALPSINFKALNKMLFPLPPLAEQYRIVACVEELMAKIDELEVIENNLRDLHQAFPNDMKASLLQSAMQGKLTEQLPEDGNAKDLLEQIKSEKEWLIKEKKIKKEKTLAPIMEDEIPFDIPDNWEWCRLKDISVISAGGTPSRSEPKYWNGNIPWIKIGDMSSKFVSKADEYITEEGLNNSSAKWVEKGTILYSIFASIGTVSILDFRATTNQAIASVSLTKCLSRDYIYYVLVGLKRIIIGKRHGMAQFNINQDILKNALIPIPPLAEQKRIVEKLDKLLPLCDSLQNEL